MADAGNCTIGSFGDLINNCEAGSASNSRGITTRAFALNLATGIALFVFNLTGFFLLKSSSIGRRIYQPKTYLVPDRVRVEVVPTNPLRWIHRIFQISGEDLKVKCGLDGYFFIRFIRAMIIVFAPLMIVIVTVLLPINYNGGKGDNIFYVGGDRKFYNISGLDTLSWQNVAPTETNRYWAHLLSALLAISWTLYRIYREKLHFIKVRQEFLLSPEHRLKASARTVLITNIPEEFQSDEALKAFFDVFVDNDDRSRLHVWVNRDYSLLKAMVMRRRKLRHALEKAELKALRAANKQKPRDNSVAAGDGNIPPSALRPEDPLASSDRFARISTRHAYRDLALAFDADCREQNPEWRRALKGGKEPHVVIGEDDEGNWSTVSLLQKLNRSPQQRQTVPKAAWLRFEIARCTAKIEEMHRSLHNEQLFARQNSAFVQFDRQMSANMACSLVSHHLPGKMTPRFLDVAPHEILWPNMGLTTLARSIRTCIAILLFLVIIVLWSIPAAFLTIMSQLSSLRNSISWLAWLKEWPDWVLSLISGPVAAILLALLVQLVVPALCRKIAVLCGAPTRSKREVSTQAFYFTFLFIELVLVTSVSSGLIATIPTILANPTAIANTLATDLPKGANYFFNYLIIQGLGFSGSVLFQYLRVLYITTIWPWFTQTPREEAWLQTTIPHQMWGNVYPLITNFAAIGLIYSVIAPLMLVFISATFMLLWVAYRHNYYYVQRVKVDTHGKLFCQALSQLFAGIYILEIALIGLFFLVRDTAGNVACKSQAIIMIVALALTAGFHYTLELNLQPLYELLPVSLEDPAVEAEKVRFSSDMARLSDEGNESSARPSIEVPTTPTTASEHGGDTEKLNGGSTKRSKGQSTGMQMDENDRSAANTRRTLLRLRTRVATRLARNEEHVPGLQDECSRRRDAADQLGAAIAAYPDELTDLSYHEREAELKVAYQDPVTREPAPIIWIPQDTAGISEEMIKRASRYGRYVQYSNAGAYLTKRNKCEITRPAPDVRTDWLLDWVL